MEGLLVVFACAIAGLAYLGYRLWRTVDKLQVQVDHITRQMDAAYLTVVDEDATSIKWVWPNQR